MWRNPGDEGNDVKRRLLTIVVLLLAGAVVNVGVAWGSAWWMGDFAGRRTMRALQVTVNSSGQLSFPSGGVIEGFVEAGFPCLTLTLEGQRSIPPGSTLGPQPAFLPTLPRVSVLPIRPIWPGFAINSAFYATLLWFLILGPFVMRRFLRVKRGLCPKCAYPVGESEACSECGATLATKATT